MAEPSQAPQKPPPRGLGEMQKREMWLAYGMLAPTFLMVLAIVLFPLIANFWISFKPVTLGDLRAPVPIANERLRGKADAVGDAVVLHYRLRSSSPKKAIANVVLEDVLPAGLDVQEVDERCTLVGRNLRCELGDFSLGFRGELTLPAVVSPAYLDDPVNPRDSKPLLTGDAENVLTSSALSLENYRRIFSSPDFWGVLRVSLYYTIFGTAGALLLGLFAAQLLNSSFPGRSFLRGLFLFPYVAPVIAVAFTWVILLDPFSGTLNAVLRQVGVVDGPINFFGQRSVPISVFGLTINFPVALTTVIVFEAWRYFPLSFLFILARMQSIPAEIYEAAEIDGATPLQQFWHISLPQLAGILAVLFLLRFIWTFNKFDDIFLLTGGGAGTRTLTVDVYEQGFAVSNLGAGAAVAVVVFVVLLVFATIFIRYAPKDGKLMVIGRGGITGLIAGLVTGLIFGGVWMLVIGITFMLISGAVAVPPIGAAAISGLVSAGIYMSMPPERRTRGFNVIPAAAILPVHWGLTAGQPLGLSLGQQWLYQAIGLAAFAALTWFSIHLCLNGVGCAHLTRYQLEKLFIRVMKGLGFMFFTVMVALPFYVMVMTSLKKQQSLLANPLDYSIDLSQGWGELFRSYFELFTDYHFGSFLLNSALVSICTVVVTLAFSIPGAYAVARLRFPGQAFLSQSILLIYMVPAIILVIPLYAVFSQAGLRDSLFGLLIVYPATTIPVAVYMLQGYFRGLPAELEEAGLVDGLSRIGVIMKITLPLSLPALASVALYVFMIAWNEFLFAFMFLDNQNLFTLSRGIVSLNSSEVPRQHLMAGAVIATVPVLIIFLYFERYLVAGLTAGSVKG